MVDATMLLPRLYHFQVTLAEEKFQFIKIKRKIMSSKISIEEIQ